MTKLRIVYMGTPDFAVPSLKAIHEKHEVVAVVTAPDRPAGRGRQLKASPVKQFALEAGIPVLQPEKLKASDFLEELAAYKANLQVVVAFRMLPEVVWNMPEFGTINLHGSLLPDYRGAAPINWAVINGESKTGLTTFQLKHEIDTGDVLYQLEIPIEEKDTAGSMHDKMMVEGADLLLKTLDAFAKNEISAQEQTAMLNGRTPKHAPKIFKADCKINWDDNSHSIHNKVRGLSPYPCAWTALALQEQDALSVKVYRTTVLSDDNLAPGEISSDQKSYLHIGTSTFNLSIEELQMAGKKRMNVQDFLRGFTLPEYATFH